MKWKKNDVYKMTGVSATPGKVTDAKGVEYNVTPELLKTVFENFDDAVPAYFTHSNRSPIGFITDLAYNDSDDTIHYTGYIFKKEKERVINEGFDMVSPEIDGIDDAENPSTGFLTGMAYTSRPAMDVGKSVCSVMFSEVENELEIVENKVDEEIKLTETPELKQEATVQETKPIETVKPIDAASAAEIELAKQALKGNIEADKVRISQLEADYNLKSTEYEDTKKKLDVYREKYESIIATEVGQLEAELKKKGFEKPEEFAKDFGIEERLELLKSAKASIAKTAPISTPPDTEIGGQVNDSGSMANVAKKFGITNANLLKYL